MMLASSLVLSLATFAAVVSAIAIAERRQPGGWAKIPIQREIGGVPISTFSFGPSTTVYLGGGSPVPGATNSSSTPALGTPTASSAASSVESSKTRLTASSTVAVTGTIPTFSYFPSSTVPVSLRPTSQPSAGAGSGNRDGNGAGSNNGDAGGDEAGNGDGDGSSDGGQANQRDNLVDLLRGILDLLEN
ncbi:hypothetical protein F5Y14DRAFT_238041 [Nemania sp. NC0429]|nr:hypothetical protein F5Y14DRAFT_238041 [Nemania sp. NC0429]